MNIKKEVKLTSEDLTNKIKFHGETNADNEACEKIKELDELIESVLWNLVQTKQETERNPHAVSSQEIRKELDSFFKGIEAMGDVYFERDV